MNVPVGGETPHTKLIGVTIKTFCTVMPSPAIFSLFFFVGMSHIGCGGGVFVLFLELFRKKQALTSGGTNMTIALFGILLATIKTLWLLPLLLLGVGALGIQLQLVD